MEANDESRTGQGQESLSLLLHSRFHGLTSVASSTANESQPPLDLPLADSRMRSLAWRILLLHPSQLKGKASHDFSSDVEGLLSTVRASRASYSLLQTKFVAPLLESVPDQPEAPEANDVARQLQEALDDDHPLNPSSSSHWAFLRTSEALRQEVAQDVERCMPEDPFFRDAEVQRNLGDLIFVWCRENVASEGSGGYRQGMHELAGVVMSVVHGDAAEFGGAKGEQGLETFKEIFDTTYVEHDTFALFSCVMEFARQWYYIPAGEKENDGDSPMLATSRRLFYDMLPKADPELAAHLKRLDVLPQIFLMRWVRLLFGREFKMEEVQRMWDLLFSFVTGKEEFGRVVEGTCLVMILRIRWELLEADTNGALMLLLRYPSLPEDSKFEPADFVRDGREIIRHLNQETGASMIERYTERLPAEVVPSDDRPSTPDNRASAPFLYPATSILGRAKSPFSASNSSPAALENLIADAARGVLRSGERWGVNQAVRDVVRGIQQHAAASSVPATPPRFGPVGNRRRPLGVKSETHGAIAANVLRRINALEDRNKHLASMLDGGVQELWKIYEQMSDKKDDGEKKDDDDELTRMCKAVAKVQFVQAFLKDLSLPLPEYEEEVKPPPKVEAPAQVQTPTKLLAVESGASEVRRSRSSTHMRSTSSVTGTPTRKPFERLPSPPKQTSSTDDIAASSDEPPPQSLRNEPRSESRPSRTMESIPSRPSLSQSPAKSIGRTPSPAKSAAPHTPIAGNEHDSTPTKARRPLAESSFSWMLQDSAASATEGSPAFTRATSFAPNERRTHVAAATTRPGRPKGKAFLFGDDPLSGEAGVAAVSDESSLARARRGSRRRDTGSDFDASERKAREEIGLDDVAKAEP
jgi:TBC1 domain family member 5